MILNHLNDEKHWRERAAEIRSVAMIMDDEQTQDILYRLADDYDQLAARIAERAAKPSPT
jgi:hypothetical protein